MALAKVLSGTKLYIKIGDGDDPEVFAHPCLINTSRGIQFTAEGNDVLIPDCADPDLIAWLGTEKRSKSATINGAGVLHTPNFEEYFDWFDSKDPKNVRVELGGVAAGDGGGYLAGKFHLMQLEATGDRGDKVSVTMTLKSDGAVTWTDAT